MPRASVGGAEGTSNQRPRRARPIKKLTMAEINALAINIVSGKTFITNSMEGYTESFGILFMFWEGNPQDFKNVGAVYEDYAKALSRAINGKPWFTSAKLLNRKDLKPLLAEMDRVREALKPANAPDNDRTTKRKNGKKNDIAPNVDS